MKAKEIFSLIKESVQRWSRDRASRLAAALAYYTIFSIAPLLIIAIAIAGRVLGEAAVRGEIVGQIEGTVGTEAAVMIQTMLENAQQPGRGLIAGIIGGVTLIFGASGVVGQLRDAMNTIWDVAPDPNRSIWTTVKRQLTTFGLVIGVGILLLALMLLSTALAAAWGFFADLLPVPYTLVEIGNWVLSLAVLTGLFALLFKVVPEVEIEWSDVWVGAGVTAFLFILGRWGISLYLGRASPASVYGAAGSLVILLLWIYYSAQILLLGAEFTQVYANRYGSRIRPAEEMVPVTDEVRAQQGMAPRGMTEQMAQAQRSTEMAPVMPQIDLPTGRPFEGEAAPISYRVKDGRLVDGDRETGSSLEHDGRGRGRYVAVAAVSAALLWRLLRGQSGGEMA